jgi:hypothetical protein
MASDIPDSEHREDVALLRGDMGDIIRGIDWDEDSACENGNGKEKPTKEAEEAEKNDGIKPNFIKEVGFFRVNEW